MKQLLAFLLAGMLSFVSAGCSQLPPPQTQDELSRSLPAFEALKSGEIHSILVVGDSISDGNTDAGCIWAQEDRAAAGNRCILTDESGSSYYENARSSQGWVKYLRAQAEDAGVSLFHNDAIGGMSAKWFNAHKELLFAEQSAYDAIFVMLGTNDRTACASAQEFQSEYDCLLSYLEARCTYLTVLIPIPAIYDPTDTEKNLTSAQIAENIRGLCQENSYDSIDCYRDFPQYAADAGLSLGQLYWGGTHPNHAGYAALWQSIAHAPSASAEAEDTESITCIGCNLDYVTGETPINALNTDGTEIYPIGVSWYYTWNPFTDALPYGAFLETHRFADGSAVQYARTGAYQPTEFSLLRRWQDGRWTGWENNDQ